MDSSARIEQRNQKINESVPSNDKPRKRTRSPSRDSSMLAENRQAAASKRPSNFDANAGVSSSVMIRQVRKVEEPVRSASKSSDDDHQRSTAENWRSTKDMESDGDEDHGIASPVNVDDRKAAKRRRKEERKLRKEEKRRKREERHKRKEEKRASKASSKGITSVTPPPDLDNRMMRPDDFDSAEEGLKGEGDDMEVEQRRLENELRRKALDSIRARKVVSS